MEIMIQIVFHYRRTTIRETVVVPIMSEKEICVLCLYKRNDDATSTCYKVLKYHDTDG